MSDRTVLFIGFTWPEPASTAAGCRTEQLLHFFTDQKYRTVFASTALKGDHSLDLKEIGAETMPIKINNASFDRFITDLQPKYVVFDRFLTEEQFGWRVAEFTPDAIRILDTEDLHSLRKTRETLFKNNVGNISDSIAPSSEKIISEKEAWRRNDLTKRESASMYRCDLSLIISTYEMQLLTTTLNVDEALLLHLPFMLNTVETSTIEKWPPFEARKDFVCIGNGKHAPNIDAIVWLKKEIWPSIRKQLPDACLNIYGAYFPEHIQRMDHPNEGFHIMDWAKDAIQVLSSARLNLAPLRFGAGIKGKLVDAMQAGTPSITTSIGAEGMHSDLPWSGCIENSAEDFATAAVGLYQHPQNWELSQKRGINIINSIYNKNALSEKLSYSLNKLENNLEQHRDRNFIGAMLMHHTLKSTKYMAKWIEEKNRPNSPNF